MDKNHPMVKKKKDKITQTQNRMAKSIHPPHLKKIFGEDCLHQHDIQVGYPQCIQEW
jgi:hypothetical protein